MNWVDYIGATGMVVGAYGLLTAFKSVTLNQVPYENSIFPVGNFFRTHKKWEGEKFTTWDRIKCFFGWHPIYFFNAGITQHCACCRWYHNTTLVIRLRHLRSDFWRLSLK